MQMLAYYCATNYRKINIVSSNVEKRALQKLKESVVKDPCSAVLNSQTGDYFLFDVVTV